MDTRRIGSLEVSVVGLGCNNFGRRLDYEATSAVVDAAIDASITFFDTADVYGNTRIEEYLGRALGRRREDVVVATKVAIPKLGVPIPPTVRGPAWPVPEEAHEKVEGVLREAGLQTAREVG